MIYKLISLFIFMCFTGITLFAQQAIVEIETDDTLPIAHTRFDDAVEPPKNNFSSINKNDTWEKFERGELDQKAFMRLQEQYQAQAGQSKDPYVKRKLAATQRRKIKLEKAKLVVKKKDLKRMPANTKSRKSSKKK